VHSLVDFPSCSTLYLAVSYSAVNVLQCRLLFLFSPLRKLQVLRNSWVFQTTLFAGVICVYAVCWWLSRKMYWKNKLLSRYPDVCAFKNVFMT